MPVAPPRSALTRSTDRPGGRARRRVGLIGIVLALSLAATACYSNPDPREWGAAAKKNFVQGCSSDLSASGGTTTSIAVAPSKTCECIYKAMVNDYNLSWSDMKDYEAKQADAKAGDKPPTPPKALTSAINDCKPKGPGLG